MPQVMSTGSKKTVLGAHVYDGTPPGGGLGTFTDSGGFVFPLSGVP